MRRSPALISVLALVSLAAVACSGGSSPTANSRSHVRTTHLSAYQLVSASAGKTEAAKTARIGLRATISGIPKLANFEMTGSGRMDLVNRRAFVAVRVPLPQGTFSMREIVDGLSFYMQLPEKMMNQLPGNASWIKVNAAAIAKSTGVGMPGLGSSWQMDPTQTFDYMKGVSGNVQDLGTGTVRGVSVHHYRAVVDLQKAMAKMPAASRCGLEAATKQFGQVRYPVDAWIDAQGRLRRMTIAMHLPARAGIPLGMGMRITMDMYDFGAPVSIHVPPPSEVYDVTQQVASSVSGACGNTTT